MVDTGSVHHYLPAITTKVLLFDDQLKKQYLEVRFRSNDSVPLNETDAGWRLISDTPSETPLRFVFADSKIEWPVDLKSPIDDEYVSIMSAGQGHPAVLGMPFIARYGVIFDFTKEKERVGFFKSNEMGNEDDHNNDNKGQRPRDRLVQFIVGSSLGLGIAVGWKWYEGSLL